MRSLALLCLCACNQVYGLDNTHLTPPDALSGCAGELKFSPYVAQVVFQRCSNYQIGATRAIAVCEENPFSEGKVDGPLEVSTVLLHDQTTSLDQPALWPDGDTVFLRQFSLSGQTFGIFAHNSGKWTWQRDVNDLAQGERIGSPSSTSPRHALVSGLDSIGIRELVDDGTTWTELRVYATGDLAGHVPDASVSVQLSPDGLRMVFFVYKSGIYYSRRAQLGDPFPMPPLKLEGAPPLSDVFLTADCQRLYFSGLSSIFFETEAS